MNAFTKVYCGPPAKGHYGSLKLLTARSRLTNSKASGFFANAAGRLCSENRQQEIKSHEGFSAGGKDFSEPCAIAPDEIRTSLRGLSYCSGIPLPPKVVSQSSMHSVGLQY
jgi:hypothetical protein